MGVAQRARWLEQARDELSELREHLKEVTLIAAAFDRPERPVKILPGAPIKLADVPIGVKLATIFGGLFLVVAALGALSVLRIGMVNRAGDAIISNWLPGLQLAGEVLDLPTPTVLPSPAWSCLRTRT